MNEKSLRACVSAWPGVVEDLKWKEVTVFSVGGRMFCAWRLQGPEPGGLSFRVEDERFLELTERPGFRPAPYLARAHWVNVPQPERLPAAELRALLRRSYELIRARLSKKLQRELAD
ncbi:MmcQ/YjbR family DNA-binding protein [Lysobacter silvisoli]|uniref:MmcQ/YjbR family DNA-binding protein n=1 Tax=Lysobacter silvisoli TaxID=2293254 RepID=A0A371K1S3_9GAMM|nr:MmcQ/YjbR family DNA-binding protein [Lysobacter silvisoli]RDZ27855.1 MmcQ/YjbR family DNA-binding protein [Lysobacter silvisoli]